MLKEEMIWVCPKCGSIKSGWADDICSQCKSQVIITDMSWDKYCYELTAVEKKQWEQEITDKYVKTSPLFDEKAQSKRLTEELKESYEAKHQIKCPTCQSAQVRRISTTEKVVNIAAFGLFGNKRKQQFECEHCRYRW